MNSTRRLPLLLVFALLAALALPLHAQLSAKSTLTLELAKKISAKAETEAAKNKWTMVIAIVDDGGNLLHLARMDGTQLGSVVVA
jgi:uncharacterized protein GlcG (DUF336 family)